jgi:hypothetical protein
MEKDVLDKSATMLVHNVVYKIPGSIRYLTNLRL